MCYKTILHYVSKNSELSSFGTTDKNSFKEYQDFMRKMFSKAFLDEEKKIEKTIEAIEKEEVDIVFLQEVNERIMKAFNTKVFKMIISSEKESMIILRKSKFNHIYDEKHVLEGLGEKIKENLVWNKDICVAFADNLILVSGHLSSKT